MFGIFIVPAKSDNTEFEFHSNGKKALSLDEEHFVQMMKHSHCVSYFVHWKDDYDGCSDIEKIDALKKYYDRDYTQCKKLKSPKNFCYVTEDKEYYIRIVTHNKTWFDKNYGI